MLYITEHGRTRRAQQVGRQPPTPQHSLRHHIVAPSIGSRESESECGPRTSHLLASIFLLKLKGWRCAKPPRLSEHKRQAPFRMTKPWREAKTLYDCVVPTTRTYAWTGCFQPALKATEGDRCLHRRSVKRLHYLNTTIDSFSNDNLLHSVGCILLTCILYIYELVLFISWGFFCFNLCSK